MQAFAILSGVMFGEAANELQLHTSIERFRTEHTFFRRLFCKHKKLYRLFAPAVSQFSFQFYIGRYGACLAPEHGIQVSLLSGA